MYEIITKFFSNDGFAPHGYCLTWRPDVFWTDVIADGAIALSYFSIPMALIYFALYRKDMKFRWVLVLFGVFIVACGTTHVLNIWTLWVPDYGLDAACKAVTAGVSVATAIVLWPLMPRALAIPSRSELERANAALVQEAGERMAAQRALEALNLSLESRIQERTRDLLALNSQLGLEIHERQRAEDALRTQYLFTERLLETIPVPVFYQDEGGRASGCNRAFERFFGVGSEEAVQEIARHVMPKVFDESHRTPETGHGVASTPLVTETTVRTADGSAREVVFHHALLYQAKGQVSGLVGVVWDITERKRNEEELERARRAAEQANKAKSSFLATMSHELRTPLNAILGFSEMLKEETRSFVQVSRCEEYLEYIHWSGERLLEVVNDILDISRMEAGQTEIVPGQIEVGPMVEGVLRVVREPAAKGGVDLRKVVQCEHLWGDAMAVKKILINLLSNAVKFTEPGGSVVLSVGRAVDQVGGNDRGGVELVVTDTGIGIPTGQIQRLLEPFEQMESHHSRSRGGTGLGLTIVESLVRAHGGRLDIQSAPGKGTRVTVFLADPPAPMAAANGAVQHETPGHPTVRAPD